MRARSAAPAPAARSRTAAHAAAAAAAASPSPAPRRATSAVTHRARAAPARRYTTAATATAITAARPRAANPPPAAAPPPPPLRPTLAASPSSSLPRRRRAAFLRPPRATPSSADELSPPRGDTRGAALLLEDVMLSVGPEDLLIAASLRVEPGECVGLVGANGCGKSTLLRAVAGRRGVDGGRVAVPPGAAVGFLEQIGVGGSSRTVAEEARSRMAATAAAAALAAAEAAVAALENASSGGGDANHAASVAEATNALAAARDAYDAAGGPSAERRVASVLDGLGFAREAWGAQCATLSGGWQMRVALARLLLSPAAEGAAAGNAGGLLLLDEPSNHLDAAACAYLAAFLRRSGAATLLVSHDASLLEGACDRLAEVRGGGLHTYAGRYSAFAAERARRAEAAAARGERIDAQAAKLENFITRFGAKATKATAAESKQKALDKLLAAKENDEELNAAAAAGADAGAPGDASKVALALPPPPPGAAEALILENASFGHGAASSPPQLSRVSLSLQRGMRLAILGPNGAGKSTLLAALAGELALRAGTRRVGDGVSLGVFTQDLAQDLPADAVALEHVLEAARAADGGVSAERARSVLGALGLRGDAPLRRIGDLSGGEKARVALAAFVLTPANALLLGTTVFCALICAHLRAHLGRCSHVGSFLRARKAHRKMCKKRLSLTAVFFPFFLQMSRRTTWT
jgi:ATPase subunit of ABC transporter with duplicated ATPase domains